MSSHNKTPTQGTHQKLREKTIALTDPSTGYDKKVSIKTYQLPNGMVETFFVDKDKDSVQIFAVTKDNQVPVVIQFRAGPEKSCVELPGGGLEPGEDPLEGATRELREEVGMTGHVQYVASVGYSPYSSGVRHMFVATNCERTHDLDLDPNEFLDVKMLSLKEFRELMQTGVVRGYDGAYMALDKLGLL